MSKLTSLDAAELATIRATRYLHAAAAEQRDGDPDVLLDLADARKELQKARRFLSRAARAES
ncbi:MAG: hypothetical protein M0027_12715 [Candidatus Dormibacteraeota bacterium]|jgi:hypothetical protein|nr:hypothetical protein [Candidatus Dormibacteraeota bacterium]